jgi:hypothetical protein
MRPLLRNRSAHANPPADGFFRVRDARLRPIQTARPRAINARTMTAVGRDISMAGPRANGQLSGVAGDSMLASRASTHFPFSFFRTDNVNPARVVD